MRAPPPDEPRPTASARYCAGSLLRLGGRLVPRRAGVSYRVMVEHRPEALLAWWPNDVADEMKRKGYVDDDGRLTEAGENIAKDARRR